VTNASDIGIVTAGVAIKLADLSRHLEVRRVAEELHYSPFHFQRVFRDLTGITPGRYLAALRIQRAKELLAVTTLRTDLVALDVGYESLGTFTTQFTRHVGLPPGQFRTLVDQVAGHRLSDVAIGPIEPVDGQVARITSPDSSDHAERVTFARPRTTRAARWAIGQIRREHASVQGVARQLGVRWRTVWAAIRPILTAAADDETRFAGVTTLGVDEHVWHHVSTKPPEDGAAGPRS
jgi:AraC-like DNA-binding protein